MASAELKVGIIGCGALGAVHARRFAEHPRATVLGLSDPEVGAVERVASSLSARPELRTSDYRDLLDAGLDVVCIASPDAFHVPQLLDALAANLHVLCEKPLTLDPDDLEAVISSAREVNRHVAMTYPRRYDAGIRAMRDEIRSGRWGRVTMITAYNAEDWITPNRCTWRHDPAICPGGFFYDASGHQIDTVLWATGLEPLAVRACTDNRGLPVPMVTWGTARLTDDTPFTFAFVGDAHKWREQINLHCEGADFAIENARAAIVRDGRLEWLAPQGQGETADEAFVRLILEDGPNWAPPEEMWPVLRFTRAALQSGGMRDDGIADCEMRIAD